MAAPSFVLRQRASNSSSIRAVGVLGTLKRKGDEESNTEELLSQLFSVLKGMGVEASILRLADMGLRSEKGLPIPRNSIRGDIIKAVMEADIVVFATPIWWNHHSSLIQQVLEYLDDIDDAHMKGGGQDNRFLQKVGGVVVTGHEDGAQSVVSNLLNFMHWVGFMIPPMSSVTWVGEQGMPMDQDAERRRKNPMVNKMVTQAAHNLYAGATLLRANPDIFS